MLSLAISVLNLNEIGASDGENMFGDSTQRYNPTLGTCSTGRTDHMGLQTNIVIDPAENVKGMYRLLDLIGESGSNGYGKGHFLGTT
jgi:hypothetical protein